MDDALPDPLPPGHHLGRYVILNKLVPAGMGRVYRALDTTVNVVVAVNVLAQELRTLEGRERFYARVRRTIAKNPRALLDYCEPERVPCVVMEYSDVSGAAIDVSRE